MYEHQSTFNPNMPLRDYVLYVEKVRSYSQTMETDMAVEKAVEECIKDDILKEFLLRQRAEAVKVTIYEFNQEQHNQTLREEGYAEGLAEGREEALRIFIVDKTEDMFPKQDIIEKLMLRFGLSEQEALLYYEKFSHM